MTGPGREARVRRRERTRTPSAETVGEGAGGGPRRRGPPPVFRGAGHVRADAHRHREHAGLRVLHRRLQ